MTSKFLKNQRQGTAKKVVCVCSLGMLRSPTLALVLSNKGYNTRSCGSDLLNALIPFSENLNAWADEIVFVNRENYEHVRHMVDDKKVKILDIPDNYDFGEEKLKQLCEVHYGKS